jgi:hypothetical protein
MSDSVTSGPRPPNPTAASTRELVMNLYLSPRPSELIDQDCELVDTASLQVTSRHHQDWHCASARRKAISDFFGLWRPGRSPGVKPIFLITQSPDPRKKRFHGGREQFDPACKHHPRAQLAMIPLMMRHDLDGKSRSFFSTWFLVP